MASFQPLLLPILATTRSLDLLPLDERMPCPVSVSAGREISRSHPSGPLDAYFFSGSLGEHEAHLRLQSASRLLPSQNPDRAAISFLSDDERDDVLAVFHQLITDRINNFALFGAALDASGWKRPGDPVPNGGYDVHMHDRYIAYSGRPDRHRPGTSQPLSVFQSLEVFGQVGDLNPKTPALAIAMFCQEPPSQHHLVLRLQEAGSWISWLAKKNGWGAPAPLRLLREMAFQ